MPINFVQKIMILSKRILLIQDLLFNENSHCNEFSYYVYSRRKIVSHIYNPKFRVKIILRMMTSRNSLGYAQIFRMLYRFCYSLRSCLIIMAFREIYLCYTTGKNFE